MVLIIDIEERVFLSTAKNQSSDDVSSTHAEVAVMAEKRVSQVYG
jgi:hypothetical protein